MKKIIALLIRYVPRKYLQRVAGIGLKVLGLFYQGNKVTCPVCKKKFRKFLPYGRINPRTNALCPNCLSLERHRLIWLYLEQKTDFFTRKYKVLHIAPEACFIRRFEKIHQDGYISADIESPLAKVKMDIHQIPFTENSFDVILCNHVLEHVNDDRMVMRELFRVLRPGGFAILQVPFFNPIPDNTMEDPTVTDPRQREELYGQADHVRRYGRDYPVRINESGFKVNEDEFVKDLSESVRLRYGLIKEEILYVATKPAITQL